MVLASLLLQDISAPVYIQTRYGFLSIPEELANSKEDILWMWKHCLIFSAAPCYIYMATNIKPIPPATMLLAEITQNFELSGVILPFDDLDSKVVTLDNILIKRLVGSPMNFPMRRDMALAAYLAIGFPADGARKEAERIASLSERGSR